MDNVHATIVLVSVLVLASCGQEMRSTDREADLDECLRAIMKEYKPNNREAMEKAVESNRAIFEGHVEYLENILISESTAYAEKATALRLVFNDNIHKKLFRTWIKSPHLGLKAVAVFYAAFITVDEIKILEQVLNNIDLSKGGVWERHLIARCMLDSGRINDAAFSCLIELCEDKTIPDKYGCKVGSGVPAALEYHFGDLGFPDRRALRTREGREMAKAWWQEAKNKLVVYGEGYRILSPPIIGFHGYKFKEEGDVHER